MRTIAITSLRLIPMYKEATKIAEDNGVKLAAENHIDFTSDEMLEMIEAVDSPNFGINFDTGNFLRLLDDPVAGMESWRLTYSRRT